MNCGNSREDLALYVEGDLPPDEAATQQRHVASCPECEQFCGELRASQLVFKSVRQDAVSASALAELRRDVLLRAEAQSQSNWLLRMERFLFLSVRKPRYVAAGIAVFVVVFASLLGLLAQTNPAANPAQSAAVFEGSEMLRPEGYREWVFVGSSLGLSYAANVNPNPSAETFHNVYIDPTSYQKYKQTGKFPEGAVLVLEMASAEAKREPGLQGSYEKEFMALEVSVKDSSKFPGGWGYFGFTGRDGQALERASAFPESAGCRNCHAEKAETDHVFTQFYPVLRSVGAIMRP